VLDGEEVDGLVAIDGSAHGFTDGRPVLALAGEEGGLGP